MTSILLNLTPLLVQTAVIASGFLALYWVVRVAVRAEQKK